MKRTAVVVGVGIAVRDVHDMHAFYIDTLGLPGEPLPPDARHFVVHAGATALAFFQTPTPAADLRTVRSFMLNPRGLDHVRFALPDLDSVRARLESKGIRFEPIPGHDDGVLRFQDPEGNLVGIQALGAAGAP